MSTWVMTLKRKLERRAQPHQPSSLTIPTFEQTLQHDEQDQSTSDTVDRRNQGDSSLKIQPTTSALNLAPSQVNETQPGSTTSMHIENLLNAGTSEEPQADSETAAISSLPHIEVDLYVRMA